MSFSTFGLEFAEVWPKIGTTLKFNEFSKKLLRECEKIKKPNELNKVDINEFINKSSNFPLEFGTNTCRVKYQPKERYPIIQQQIGSAYPIIHERVLWLFLNFLEHKNKYGTDIELNTYTDMTLAEFVQRLLSKRCASFVNSSDSYLLLTDETGDGESDGFAKVGTDKENYPLVLSNVMSYDEMKLSALLSISSHTEFINDGNRYNNGVLETEKTKIETSGVVIGFIGGRFEQENQMEWQDVMITKSQNTIENGYGHFGQPSNSRATDYRRLWCEFYEQNNDFLYEQAKELLKQTPRFKRLPGDDIFDNVMMKKRYTMSFDTLLLEAESRAAAVNKQAYVQVVGIGLGVWRVSPHQTEIFLKTFWQRLHALLPHLNHVGVVHFSWFRPNENVELIGDPFIPSTSHPLGGIKTFLSNRNPADKLPVEYDGMLVVFGYAWDSNALPGNEFWLGSLSGSGDPAAACSTLITELHNPHISTEMVNGENLHIATEEHGVLHISDYMRKISLN